MNDVPSRLGEALADRYRIERELGAGGMATVYLAADRKHDRQVAIKVLHPDLGAALGGDRFLAEIKTTAKLQHPHILPLLDSGEAAGLLYYVMPYVAGETVRARLERERQLPIEDAVNIACEVADALDSAHTHGIVHRDIKPENILLHGGHALVADFGIALAVQQAGGSRMTQTGLSLGTPQYMSPEQAMGERQVDARADIYALGAVMYEMLSGEPPFTGPTLQAIIAKVVGAEPERLTLVRKTIPLQVEVAVLRALAKLPADRFASARQFAAALARDPIGFSAGFRQTSATAPPHGGVAGRRRALVVAGVMIAAAGALGWMLGRGMRPLGSVASAVSASVMLPDSVEMRPQLLGAEGTATLAVSPDGRLLVAAAGHGASSRLYLRNLSQFGLRAIDGTEGGQAPFFSPAGDMLYFFAHDGLKRVTLADRHVTRLRPPPVSAFDDEAWGGTVMADGRIVLSQQLASGLLILSPTGDSVHAVKCMTTCAYPSALPDGRHVLVTTGMALWVADLETGSGTLVTRRTASGADETLHVVAGQPDGDGHLVYATLDGRLYAAPFDAAAARVTASGIGIADSVRVEGGRGAAQFAVSRAGLLVYAPGDVATLGTLVTADRTGKLDTIPAPLDNYDGFALSPDGRRVAAHVSTAGGDKIEVIDVTTGHVTPWVAARGLGIPTWTADGRRIAYAHGDTASIGNPDESGPPSALPAGTVINTAVFPLADDGTFLARMKDSVSVVRGERRVVGPVAVPEDVIYAVTGDGRWVIQHTQVADEGALVGLALDGSRRRMVIAPYAYSMPTFASGGRELIAAMVSVGDAGGSGSRQDFYSVPYDPTSATPFGRPRKLFSALVADFPGRNYAVGMGGNRFVFKQHVMGRPLREVRVVTSWHAHLATEAGR